MHGVTGQFNAKQILQNSQKYHLDVLTKNLQQLITKVGFIKYNQPA